jgi:hypothetical protein
MTVEPVLQHSVVAPHNMVGAIETSSAVDPIVGMDDWKLIAQGAEAVCELRDVEFLPCPEFLQELTLSLHCPDTESL